jgi:acyl-CoA oxidase
MISWAKRILDITKVFIVSELAFKEEQESLLSQITVSSPPSREVVADWKSEIEIILQKTLNPFLIFQFYWKW